MDQDFHFYGTYFAAKKNGFSKKDAALIAKASNFIDFYSENTYASYMEFVEDAEKNEVYKVVGKCDNPRYTYQGSFLSCGASPEDGLWCSFHFLPGNYEPIKGAPSTLDVHGESISSELPEFISRDVRGGLYVLKKWNPGSVKDLDFGKTLTRPQSSLSKYLIQDTKRLFSKKDFIERIILNAKGGEYALKNGGDDLINRFKLILLGVRAHVISDTWAHQDHCGLNNVMNTYWDVNYDPDSWSPSKSGFGRQSINYEDHNGKLRNVVLSSTSSENFRAAPNGTSYLGHGWLGHFPDYSFTKFSYKPCWSSPKNEVIRDNRVEYRNAWVEISSLFHQVRTGEYLEFNEDFKFNLEKAEVAINKSHDLSNGPARVNSANSWLHAFSDDLPDELINVDLEPDNKAVLDGMIDISRSLHRYGISRINAISDLYLFQLAADYHFICVKNFLKKHEIYDFKGSWSAQESIINKSAYDLLADSDFWLEESSSSAF